MYVEVTANYVWCAVSV